MTDAAVQAALQQQVDTPKSSAMMGDLPCGYIDSEGVLHTEVVVREITGVEEDILAARNVKIGKKMNELLGRCLQRVGTITDRKQIMTAVMDMTLGDRVYLMFLIRRATLGDSYPFEIKCTECGKKSSFDLDLSTMDTRKPEDPRKRVFDVKLPSGRTARFRVATGKDENKLTEAMEGQEAMSLGLLIRLELLDGKPPTLDDVKAMGMRDRNYLRNEFVELEGGVDTDVDVGCPKCGNEFKVTVDVGQAGFFFPSGTRRGSNKRSTG
jgi:uncharacterized protein (UPF0212 family)